MIRITCSVEGISRKSRVAFLRVAQFSGQRRSDLARWSTSPRHSKKENVVVDHSEMKLGRGNVKTDTRTLRLSKYLKDGLPAAPAAKDWTKGITNWGMMLNDIHSDCTIAAAAHAVQVWSAHTKGEITLPDSLILRYYEKWDGYKPGVVKTDGGGIELNV